MERFAKLRSSDPHSFSLQQTNLVEFSPRRSEQRLPSVSETFAASANHWRRFWSKGGAIELSRSKDPRGLELERRVVLSQYLTGIQCCGSMPPQETGLTVNSWEVSPGNALVACRALCPVESTASTGEESRLVQQNSDQRASTCEVARVFRCSLAQDGWTRRTR